MSNDYIEFCLHCGWNDCDYGCICPDGEEVYQCDLYKFYHQEEVEQFERDMQEWASNRKEV